MAVVVAARMRYLSLRMAMCTSLCPWHTFAQTQAAVVDHHRPRTPQWRPQWRSAGTAVAAAVAVCWHRTAMSLAPVNLVQQWSVEGGALSKPIGLDVKEIDTTTETVSFVKLEKNSEWLLKAVLGSANKGALRRSLLFTVLGKRLAETVADPASRWTPERASAVAESEPIDPMSQLEEIRSESATPKNRKVPYES